MVHIKSPAPVYLNEYSGKLSGNPALKVRLLLNDLRVTGREVYIKITCKTRSGGFKSNVAASQGQTFYLESGIPYELTPEEIAYYFEEQNTSGIDDELSTDMLPEGDISFCIEIFDSITHRSLAQRTCAYAYVYHNDPPFLLLPINGKGIANFIPQRIFFQWSPRHINVNAVAYEFTLKAIADRSQDVNTVYSWSSVIHREVVTEPYLNYDNTYPLLRADTRYAWQVRVIQAIDGSDTGLFRNHGYSEIYSFDYTAPCNYPLDVSHEIKGKHQANIYWDDPDLKGGVYLIRYREKVAGSRWFFSKTRLSWLTLWDLRPGTTYEYQVMKQCEEINSDYAKLRSFTTGLAVDSLSIYDCGIVPEMNVRAEVPLQQLEVNDVFKAGGFPVKVTKVKGSDGIFTGNGYITIPYLGNMKVAVKFTGVFINSEQQLADGVVLTIYDKEWDQVVDADEVIDAIEDIGDVVSGGDLITINPLEYDIEEDDISIENGKIIIDLPDGNQLNYDHDPHDVVIITDASGDQFTIAGDGEVRKIGEGATGGPISPVNTEGISMDPDTGDIVVDTIADTGIEINYYLGKGTRYGIDIADHKTELAYYPSVAFQGQRLYPPHKAVVSGQEDFLYVGINFGNTGFEPEDIVVKTKEGRAIPTEVLNNGSDLKLTLKGLTPDLDEEIIIALHPAGAAKDQVISMFFLHHLRSIKDIQVHVVLVNAAAKPKSLESELTGIFKTAGAALSVSFSEWKIAQNDWDTEDHDGLLTYDGSGLLSDYPEEFRSFIRVYKKRNFDYESGTYYLFICGEEIRNSAGISGFMPPGRQWGFVFGAQDSETLEFKPDPTGVAIHELGHGIFQLKHIFRITGELPDENSGNLMDYGPGIALTFLDWKQMSDPSLKLNWFDPVDDGEIGNRIWFTPDWKPFTIKNTQTIASKKSEVPAGTIPGFRIENTYYYATFENDIFQGYQSNSGRFYEEIQFRNPQKEDPVYLFQDNGGCGRNAYYRTTYNHLLGSGLKPDFNSEEIDFVAMIECAEVPEETAGYDDLFSIPLCETDDATFVGELPEATPYIAILNEAYARRGRKGDAVRSQGDYFHLINFSEGDLNEKREVLEDKLFLLDRETRVNFYVMKISLDSQLNSIQADELAKQILEASDLPDTKRSILIIIPSTERFVSTGKISCLQSGLAVSEPTMLSSGKKFREDSLFSFLLDVYSDIEKPFRIFRGFYRANGSFVHLKTTSGEFGSVRGLPYINYVAYYESPNLTNVKKLQVQISELKTLEKRLVTDGNLEEVIKIRNDYVARYNELLKRSWIEENEALRGNDITFWKRRVSDIGQLREPFIPDKDIRNAYLATFIKGDYLERWKILFARSSLEEDHIYNYSNLQVIDETVYGIVDAISVIPNLDTAAELSGMLYAGIRGDFDRTITYAASLAIPLTSAHILQTLNSTPASLAVYARKKDTKLYYYLAETGSVGADEVQVSPILTGDASEIEVLKSLDKSPFFEEKSVKELLELPKAWKQRTNPFEISWDNELNVFDSPVTATEFFDLQSETCIHFSKGDYYLKFNPETGMLLYGNRNTKELLGFYEGITNIEIVNAKGINKIGDKLAYYHGQKPDGYLSIPGIMDIVATTGKTTTIIGNYTTKGMLTGDMKAVIEELLFNMKNSQFGAKPGGFNVLNVSDRIFNGSSDFWKEYNKPWLKAAIDRGDIIYAVTDPLDVEKVFKNVDLVSDFNIIDFETLKKAMKHYISLKFENELTGFGKEINLLINQKYSYNSERKIFEKW
ncbi:hypothetical protein DMZ48_09840 [Robertkochia solimangrovi]|nr:hypothetical protein DMZ48_09840 [Robertkochia solimangrovi]